MSGEVEAVAPTGQAARSAGQESECKASAPRRTPQGTPQVAPAQAVELIQVQVAAPSMADDELAPD